MENRRGPGVGDVQCDRYMDTVVGSGTGRGGTGQQREIWRYETGEDTLRGGR